MMKKHVWIVVSAALLNGWMAHAQGPAFPGYGPPATENPNPNGIPAPISPDAKFRPADPFAVPAPIPPDAKFGAGGLPYGYQNQRNGPPPYMNPPPGMGPMRPGMVPYGYPNPGLMSAPPGMNPGMMQFPPTPTPTPNPNNPGKGEPYLVPPEKSETEKLPARLPPPTEKTTPAAPLPSTKTPETCANPDVVEAVSFQAPAYPSEPQEPYLLYEGGRSQIGLFSTEVQSGYRVWLSAEYLYWWSQNSPAPPPLATTTPFNAPFIPGSPRGSIGRPDTTIVLGGQPLELPSRGGARFTFGTWFDCDQTVGIEANYFLLSARTTSQNVAASGEPTDVALVNPFLDTDPLFPGEGGNLISGLGIFQFGSSTLNFSSQLQGAELNAILNMVQWYGLNINVLGGFRYLNLWENLEFLTTQQGIIGGPVGQFQNTFDGFKTRNNYFAGQVGVRADYQYCWLFINGTAKIAYGNMVEAVTIDGRTTTNTANGFGALVPTQTVAGGIYALPTNIGQYSRNRDVWMPEFTVNAGVQVCNWMRIFGGYNFMYVNHVARPGDQIDRSINSSQLPSFSGIPVNPLVGAPNPSFTFRDSSYWAQGLNFGMELRW